MKHLFAVVLAAALMVTPVWALDDPAEGEEEEQTAEAVTVTTLEQLQDAIDAAEDGDTIEIAQTITINGETATTDKDITLTRAEGMSGELLQLWNGGEISGFTFAESGAESSYATISIDYCYNSTATINNCNFSKEEGVASYIIVYGNIYNDDPNRATISGSNFELSAGRAITTRNHTHITLDGCSFTAHGGGIAWAVDNVDTAIIADCAIVGNGTDSFSIRNGGTMQIEDSVITRDNRDSKAVFDIFATTDSNLTITSCSADDGIYNVPAKTAVELPLNDYSGELQLVYLTEGEATAYFAPDEPEEPDEPEDTQEPPQQPQDEPQTEQGNNPTDTPAEPPARENEPTAPEDQTEDKPAAPEVEEQPDAPEQDGAEDNAENEQTTPAEEKPQPQPEQPREYIPYTPIYTPSLDDSDSGNDAEDTPTAPAVEVASTDTPSIDALICGGVAMNTTQRLDLDDMGGAAIQDKPLTRVDMAMLIYGLLDADTITQDSDSGSAFADVPPDAEYALFVQIIASCGIVQGVGGGNYAPEALVSWAQIIVLLARFVPSQDHALQYISCPAWAQDAMQTAVAYGWIEDSASFDATAEIARGEFAALVNAVLDMAQKGATAV